ncbi:hypothetical protein SAMN04490369_108612 [Vreelandella aquamarina]|uniref:Uncharacterized protein n=1 Tax=Vreelandella aquamarina TaxID=77097 RepID=A0A1H8PHN0_9GAMM|nr:hypothetical protein SAMN04490369_108612 [Halomonas aquamarina]
MDSLSNLIHCCDEMPSDGVSICWGPARFGSEDLGWCLVIERVATEDDLQVNQYLEEVGDTLWTTAVEIKCCPYCGVGLTDARSVMSSEDFGYFIHIDSSGWLGRRC